MHHRSHLSEKHVFTRVWLKEADFVKSETDFLPRKSDQ